MKRLAVLTAALLLLVPMPLRGQEEPDAHTLQLGQGLSVELPDGWSLDGEQRTGWESSGLRRVHVACKSEGCEDTQETCTFVLQKESVEGADDAARIASLYDTALSRYTRMRAVLKNSAEGATLRAPLARTPIGPRDWWVVETQGAVGYKSSLFAETAIGGRYLGAICKTCETGEIRHETARGILSSARKADEDGGS